MKRQPDKFNRQKKIPKEHHLKKWKKKNKLTPYVRMTEGQLPFTHRKAESPKSGN
ncbi:hypothetical protein Hanom_Chr06g00512921 [Helianthus anomalus]